MLPSFQKVSQFVFQFMKYWCFNDQMMLLTFTVSSPCHVTETVQKTLRFNVSFERDFFIKQLPTEKWTNSLRRIKFYVWNVCDLNTYFCQSLSKVATSESIHEVIFHWWFLLSFICAKCIKNRRKDLTFQK